MQFYPILSSGRTGGGPGAGEENAEFNGGIFREWTDEFGVVKRASDYLLTDVFNVTKAGMANLLLVGGGGSGGSSLNTSSGGGGGGGRVRLMRLFLPAGLYQVQIGAGGNGDGSSTVFSNSSLTINLVAEGGGRGAGSYSGSFDGASGGGASWTTSVSVREGGNPISPETGSKGGRSVVNSTDQIYRCSAGGGGFSSSGGNTTRVDTSGGRGGGGFKINLWEILIFGAGGGGGGGTGSPSGGHGADTGGNGGNNNTAGGNATPNTGSGGGGGGLRVGSPALSGGEGADGRVIIWADVNEQEQ